MTSWSGIQHLFHQFNLAERDQLRVKLPNELLGAPSAAFSPKLRVTAESGHRFHKNTMVAGLAIITVVSDVRCVQSERIAVVLSTIRTLTSLTYTMAQTDRTVPLSSVPSKPDTASLLSL